jgi:hypothetical protein
MASWPEPTLPDGTEVKKGESPKRQPSRTEAGGLRNTSTSDARANWGILVSSFVETSTVLESSGSICARFQIELTLDNITIPTRYLSMLITCTKPHLLASS